MSELGYNLEGSINDAGLNAEEKLRLARFCYRNNIPYITNAEYDRLYALFQRARPKHVMSITTYDDDPTPLELLEQVGFTENDIMFYANLVRTDCEDDESQHFREVLTESVAKSIKPHFDLQGCYEAFEEVAGHELCISAKIDGIKGKCLFQIERDAIHQFKFAITRAGQSGALPINITRNMSRIIPHSFSKLDVTDLLVDGEIQCLPYAVDILNSKYSISLATGRSAGLSMIRNNMYLDSDYKYLIFLVHGINVGRTLSEGLAIAEDLGFEVVPHMTYVYESKSIEEFESEIAGIIRKIKGIADADGYDTDGLVVMLNDRRAFAKTFSDTAYDGGNFSVKIGAWKPGRYTSEIEEIVLQQQADRFSVRLIIKPVKTETGITVSTINIYNVATMIEHDLVKGSRICFEYKNATTPLFLYNADKQDGLRELEYNSLSTDYFAEDEEELD